MAFSIGVDLATINAWIVLKLEPKNSLCDAQNYFLKFDRAIGLMRSVFANGLEDRGSIPDCVIPKTQKMVFDATLLNTQHYEVRIKGKVEQSREWSCTLSYTSV